MKNYTNEHNSQSKIHPNIQNFDLSQLEEISDQEAAHIQGGSEVQVIWAHEKTPLASESKPKHGHLVWATTFIFV